MPEPPAHAAARRSQAQVEELVAELHGGLRLSARIASELDPLAVDKQKLIVVAAPELVSPEGALLLERQCQRGRVVVAWSAVRAGRLAGHRFAWTRDPRQLLALARSAGVLPAGTRLHPGPTLRRVLEFGGATLTGRITARIVTARLTRPPRRP